MNRLKAFFAGLALGSVLLGNALGTPARPIPSPDPSETPLHMTAKQMAERDPKLAIPEVMKLQEKAWNRGDIKTFMSGYLNSDATTFTSGGNITTGWQTVLDRYEKRYGSNHNTMGTLRFENLQITPLGKDYALCVGNWFLQQVSTRPAMEGVFSLVWEHTKQGWKIIHDHSSARENK